MIQSALNGLRPAATQAAQWIDRLRDANAQDLEALRDWLRQSPEHLEELLCAAAIDLAIHLLADRNLLSSAQSSHSTQRTLDLAPESVCATVTPARPDEEDGPMLDLNTTRDPDQFAPTVKTQRPRVGGGVSAVASQFAIERHFPGQPAWPLKTADILEVSTDPDRLGESELLARTLTKIRACALAITADDCAAEGIVRLTLQHLSQLAGNRSVASLERLSLDIARAASRAWLEQRHARARSGEGGSWHAPTGRGDEPLPTLAQWRGRLRHLGARRAEMLVRTRLLGQPIRRVALSMGINTPTVREELSRVYLHLMSALDGGQPSNPSIACRLLSLLKLRLRR